MRRTKDTMLDGKPIITLPSKDVELVRVEFTNQEKRIYDQLSKKTREQFKNMENKGQVFRKYATVLSMLLRKRQACAHVKLLPKDADSVILPFFVALISVKICEFFHCSYCFQIFYSYGRKSEIYRDITFENMSFSHVF